MGGRVIAGVSIGLTLEGRNWVGGSNRCWRAIYHSSEQNREPLGASDRDATPGNADVWGGFGGLGLEWRTRNVTFFSTAEYLALSDNSTVVSGRAGLRIGL